MQNVDRDIIVIGAGGCGLMAAKKGARVLLLEKEKRQGQIFIFDVRRRID